MPKIKHLHIYKRKYLGKNGSYIVYACIKPDCGHYIVPSLLEGKRAECPRCNGDYIVTRNSLDLAFPHCPNCVVKKDIVGQVNAN